MSKGKERNPRVVVLEILRMVKAENLDYVIRRWSRNGTRTVWTPVTVKKSDKAYPGEIRAGLADADGMIMREYVNSTTRKRMSEEYPENQPEMWRELYVEVSDAIAELRKVQAIAEVNFKKTLSALSGATDGGAR